MATSSNNPTQSSVHANIIPSEVGWQFVPQYYTFVNKQPQRLHCFYTKNSTFIHGTEGEDGKPCFGQQEIHNKILSIGFQDCKVFIHSVDAQSSANGGIIIQVIGEMSNRGEPWRKFAQTFFLAPQQNGYFVLNDIFRFLKEESVEDEEEVEQPDAAPPPPVEVAQENTVEPAAPGVQAGHPVVAAAPYDAALPNHLQQQSISEPSEPAEVVAMEEKRPTVNGYHTPAPEPTPAPAPIPQAEPIKQAPVEEPTPASPAAVQRPVTPQIVSKPTPSPTPVAASPTIAPAAPTAASVVAQQQQPPPPPPAAAPSQPAEPARAITPTPAAAATPSPVPAAAKPAAPAQPAAPPKPAAPKTWANLAALNSNKWGPRVAQDAKGVSAAPPAPPAPQVAHAPAPVKSEPNAGDKEGRELHPTHQAALNVSTPQCFIKGVTEVVSHQALGNALARFGPHKGLDIVRTKACAFVEFNTLDAARKAIIASLPANAGGEGGVRIDTGNDSHTRIIVETRKERSERPSPRTRTGNQQQQGQGGQGQNQERSGGGGDRGSGGGFRGNATRGRGSGRGGGAGGKS